jgi:DNA polymerase-3 subunit epsilon
MTRGQEALAIDRPDEASVGLTELGLMDLSRFNLPVLPATDDEMQGHEAVLDALDKSSSGHTVWRKMSNSVA